MVGGVPGTELALGMISRFGDGFPGSHGFPELTKRMQHIVFRLVRTRIEGCSQTGHHCLLKYQCQLRNRTP